jgi:hypothetical protein
MPQTTGDYKFDVPTPGASSGVWGSILNTALDAIDIALTAVKATANSALTFAQAALPKAGGNMTGNVGVRTDTYDVVSHGAVAGNRTLDLSAGRLFTFTPVGSTTVVFENVPASKGVFVILEITNGGTQVSWPVNTVWPGGTTPSLRASGVDVVTLYTRTGGSGAEIWRATVSHSAAT